MLLKAFSFFALIRFGAGVVLRTDNKGRDVPGGPMWLHGPFGREGPGLIYAVHTPERPDFGKQHSGTFRTSGSFRTSHSEPPEISCSILTLKG